MLITFESEAIEHLLWCLKTPQLRINARARIRNMTVISLDNAISVEKDLLRSLRSESDSVKRGVYAEISRLERVKLELLAGDYGI